jgi:hypothetical protein
MGAVLSIYLLGVVLCIAAGIALAGLLDHRGRWVGFATIPLGFCVLVTLLYPLGALMPNSAAGPIVVAIVIAGLAVAVVLRLRAERARGVAGVAAALRPTWPEGAVLIAAVLAGGLLLAPTIDQGFATTIAVSNNDGWGYATLVDWIKQHPLPRDVSPDLAEPLTFVPWSSMRDNFGIGFEHFAATLATVLDRQGYEVVNSAAAVGLAAAAGGWATLAVALRPRLPAPTVVLAVAAVAAPIALIPFIENYTTQFVSICLWPFAVGAFALLVAEPGWKRLIIAAIASGALIGVYPAMSPWLILGLLAVALLVPAGDGWATSPLRRLAGPGWRLRIARAGALLLVLAAAVLVVAPIQLTRTAQNLLFLDDAPINTTGFLFAGDAYAAIFVGSAPVFPLIRGAEVAWPGLAGLVILALAFALGLRPGRRPASPRMLFALLGTALVLVTVVLLVRYRVFDELPYQAYKGMISTGAILAGLVVIGLIPGRRSSLRTVSVVALGCVVAIWIPVTSDNLQASVDPGTGFRAADVEMGRALDELPAGSTVLVEGAAPDPGSFQFRMMAAYFGDRAPELTAVGLGSTASYLTGGGAPEWRPARPWSDVLTARPEPVATDRTPIWSNGTYGLASAPVLDVTTYGTGWYPPEQDASGVFAWTSGPVEFVVSNRGNRAARARLVMLAASFRRPRMMTLLAGRRTAEWRLRPDRLTPVGIPLVLPPRSVTPVMLEARPAAVVAADDGRNLLVRVQDIRVQNTTRPDGLRTGRSLNG